MGKVRLQVMPLIAPAFGGSPAGPLRLAPEIGERETVRDLLRDLVDRYPGTAGVVFDPQDGVLTGFVRLVLNDRVIEIGGGLDTILADGDELVLLPAFAGGAHET